MRKQKEISDRKSESGTHMCSPTLTRQTAATTTTPLVQVACRDICPPVREKGEAEFHHLHMAWVLVADTKGGPQPRLHWLVD